jgi:hypothetical protein
MRIAASSRLVLAVAAVFVATISGTAVRAQSAATNLLGIYEQSALNTCPNTGACRVDFSTVQQNLKVLRVSCLIDIQTNAVNPLISYFELGNASADQTGYAFGQFLAPVQLLSSTSTDQFYVANVDTLHVVPAGMRPSVLIVTPITAQCSITGWFLD